MTIALVAAVGVVVQQGWAWLAVITYVVSAPQAASWLARGALTRADARGGRGVLAALRGAIGHGLRRPTKSLRLSSASLLVTNAVVTAPAWWLIDDAGPRGANAAVRSPAVARHSC
jgi:hypothetical protein